MLQSVSMFLGKSFITSEQSGVCSQLQEDPPVPLSPPGYNLPVSCVSFYRHSKVFPRLSEIIFLQGFRNLLLLSVTSFWPSVFRWDKTNRSLPFLLTTSSLILCTIYCTHSKLWSKKPISSISHSEPDKVHVFNTAFGGPRSWWVISHTSNKFVFKSTGSKVSDAPSHSDLINWFCRKNTSKKYSALQRLAKFRLCFVCCQCCLTAKMNQKMFRSSVPPHHRHKAGAKASQLSQILSTSARTWQLESYF